MTNTIREAVCVFKNGEALETAIEELESSGFDRAMISILAGEDAVAKELGHRYQKVQELEDETNVPREAFVSTASIGDAEGGLVGSLLYVGAVAAAGAVVASGGTLAAAVTAALAAGAGGGTIGAILATLVAKHHVDYLKEQIDHGGLLLWVRTMNADQEEKAKVIMAKHSGMDVHIHGVPKNG